MSEIFSIAALWEYQTASNTPPADPTVVTVPASGWSGPEAGPFGHAGNPPWPPKVDWPVNTGLWIRRNVTFDGNRDVLLSGFIENACYVYLDGQFVGGHNIGNAAISDYPEWWVLVPASLVPAGVHEVAILCLDEAGSPSGDATFISVEADYAPALLPFWARPPVSETLEWLTDVIVSDDGTEDRAQMRVNPRQSVTYSLYVPHQHQPAAKNMIYGGRARRWFVPFWPHVQSAGAISAGETLITLPTEFVDLRPASGLVLIYQSPSQYQIVGLSAVVSATQIMISGLTEAFSDAWVVPMLPGRLSQNPTRRGNGRNGDLQVAFDMDRNRQLEPAAPAQFLGYDLYTERTLLDGGGTFSEDVLASIAQLDEELGRVEYSGLWTNNRPRRSMRLMGDGLEEAWAIREFLHRRAGRLRPFWQPTFEADLVSTAAGAVTTTLTVRSDGYLTHAASRTHIALETASGWLVRTITAAEEISDTETELTLNASLAINASEILCISWLGLHRLDADRVEISWLGGQVCSVSVPIIEVQP